MQKGCVPFIEDAFETENGVVTILCFNLTCLCKLRLAFWAGNTDSTFPFRNTNLLIAGWTLINMMSLALLHHPFLGVEF